MLTPKQNAIEVMKGGNPDRFTECFDPFHLVWFCDPLALNGPQIAPGAEWINDWGVAYALPEGMPGAMPVHNEDTIVLHDIEDWKEFVKAPDISWIKDEDWKVMKDAAAQCNRDEQFLMLGVAPGLFEHTHHLMGMEGAMVAIASEPDTVREMLEYIVDWEIEYSNMMMEAIHPDALFHHDDWGTSISTFISPAQFEEIYLPPYKRLYKNYKDKGIECIVHHSDSYAATLVPYMIEMGIDVFQGAIWNNNIPELIKEYGGQISFMGGIDNSVVDIEGWTEELIAKHVRRACTECGKLYFLPSSVMGEPGCIFPGVYETIQKEIGKMSKEMF